MLTNTRYQFAGISLGRGDDESTNLSPEDVIETEKTMAGNLTTLILTLMDACSVAVMNMSHIITTLHIFITMSQNISQPSDCSDTQDDAWSYSPP
jgi:hypothetical protein